ncbi:MAG: DUF4418 family protein [Blautia sp.]|nr:DUF4418 family protein [Blautia sp.]
MKKNKLLSLISALIGVLLAVGVMTLFSACGPKEDGTWMHCHTAQMGAFACGVIIALLFLIASFSKGKVVRICLNGAAFVASAAAFAVPGIIVSMCMMQDMRCYSVMQPFVRIMSVVSAVLALCGLILAVRER